MSEKLNTPSYEDDRWAVQRDHGGWSGAIMSSVEKATGPIHQTSDAEAVRRDHGVGMGVPGDPMERYGTREKELLNTVNNLRRANWSADLKNDIEKLPPESISELISWRYKQSANALDDRGSNKKRLGENMYFDLSIIAATIDSGKEIPGIDAAQYVGEKDVRDLGGILDAYTKKIKESGVNILLTDAHEDGGQKPLDALETIATMKKALEKSSAEENK